MPAYDKNLNPQAALASTATLPAAVATTNLAAAAGAAPTAEEYALAVALVNELKAYANNLRAYVAELHADLVTLGIRK